MCSSLRIAVACLSVLCAACRTAPVALPQQSPPRVVDEVSPGLEIPATKAPTQTAPTKHRGEVAFLQECQAKLRETAADYRCVLTKQERIGDQLRPPHTVAIAFRRQPMSVSMTWLTNAGKATRIVYVAGRHSKNGKEKMWVQPKGILGLAAPGVLRDVHGPEALAESRRTIDQFGLEKMLARAVHAAELLDRWPGSYIRFLPDEQVNDRSCAVLERYSPHADASLLPEPLQITWIDRETCAPIRVLTYGDLERNTLLGRYEFTDIEWNVGLTDNDFAERRAKHNEESSR